MTKRLALIHTVTNLVPTFKDLCSKLLPEVDLFNIVDESLLQNTIREGNMSRLTARRIVTYMICAEQAGADTVMVTCSSVGEAVVMGKPLLQIPAFRVDQPMADEAVKQGKRIGVAATLRTTLDPTVRLITERAEAHGKTLKVVSRLCEGAFDAVIKGDIAKHDSIVTEGLSELSNRVDVIVLAQATMARVADALPDADKGLPILSSPRLAVEYLAEVLT